MGNVWQWTAQTVRKLFLTYKANLSYSGIAALLGTTEQAVRRKVYRLRRDDPETWGKRLTPIARRKRPRPRSEIRLPEVGHGIVLEDAMLGWKVNASNLAVVNLADHHCRWPIGDVGDADFRFCCKATGGKVYCGHHMRVATGGNYDRDRKPHGVAASGGA